MTDQPQSLDIVTGERIHSLAWRYKIKQVQIAELLGVQQSGVGKKLRGERGWSLDELRKIADAFGTSIAYLVGETDESGVPRVGFEPTAFCSEGRHYARLALIRSLSGQRVALGLERPRGFAKSPTYIRKADYSSAGDAA